MIRKYLNTVTLHCKYIKIFAFAVLVLCFSYQNTQSQNLNNLSFNLYAGYGWVAPTNSFMKGVNIDNTVINSSYNFLFEVIKETDGSKDWHNLYKNLHYGIGLYHGIFNYSKNIGNPYGLYAVMGFSPIETEKFSLKSDISLGLSGIWTVYSRENYLNEAVSTPIESYISLSLKGNYALSEKLSANIGAAFIHFSNGTILRPNKGINILTPLAGISYNTDRVKRNRVSSCKNFSSVMQYDITAYGAVRGVYTDYIKEIKPFTGDTVMDTARGQYGIFGLQLRASQQLGFQHALGIGFDISYNNTIGRTTDFYYSANQTSTVKNDDRITLSAFLSYRYTINRLSLLVEPVIYFHKLPQAYFPYFAQRVGFKYRLYKGLFAGVSLRAYNFRIADYIEWNIGYSIKGKN